MDGFPVEKEEIIKKIQRQKLAKELANITFFHTVAIAAINDIVQDHWKKIKKLIKYPACTNLEALDKAA